MVWGLLAFKFFILYKMINNSLPRFPQSLGDTFAKSWITYKSLWFVFFCFMLLFHLPAVLIFFAFQKPENLLFSIHFTDFSRFYISKMGDAFACFLLPLFLKNQLPSLTYVFKKFFSKYLLKLSLVVLLLYILIKHNFSGFWKAKSPIKQLR